MVDEHVMRVNYRTCLSPEWVPFDYTLNGISMEGTLFERVEGHALHSKLHTQLMKVTHKVCSCNRMQRK